MYCVNDEKVWARQLEEQFQVGINYGPAEDRSQLVVMMTETTISSAPIYCDHDWAERIAVGVLQRDAAARACDSANAAAAHAYKPSEPTDRSFARRWVKELRGPRRPEDVPAWSEYISSVEVQA